LSVRFVFVLAIAGALSLSGMNAPAANWTNIAGGSWATPGNWDATIPNAIDAIADFSTLDITGDLTVTLDANRTVGTLRFGDTTPSSNWSLSGPTAGTNLILSTSTGISTVTVNAGTTVTMNNVTLSAAQGFIKDGGGTWILMPGSGGGNNGGAGTTLNPLVDI